MTDQVDVDAQQVSNGAAQWEAASAELTAAWQAAKAAIDGLSNAGTWGGDSAGSSFAAHFKPHETLFKGGNKGGEAIIEQVTELGPKVEKAVGLSMAADEQQAAEMLQPQKGL